MKARWLGRTLLTGPHLTLVTSEDELAAVKKWLKNTGLMWLESNCHAKASTIENEEGIQVAVVMIRPGLMMDEYVAALTHEAVHVAQHYFEHIGARLDGESFAYAVQNITGELVIEYASR